MPDCPICRKQLRDQTAFYRCDGCDINYSTENGKLYRLKDNPLNGQQGIIAVTPANQAAPARHSGNHPWTSECIGHDCEALGNGRAQESKAGRSEYARKYAARPAETAPRTLVEHMVSRFLQWKLPENFCPDGGISFERIGNKGTQHEYTREPVGTNLLDHTQATEMVRFMLEGLDLKGSPSVIPAGPISGFSGSPDSGSAGGEHVAALAAGSQPPDYPAILERERTAVADGINAIEATLRGKWWMTEGRGSYEYNDDRWRDEFRDAIHAIKASLEPLKRIAGDWSDCPKTWEEVLAARTAAPRVPQQPGEFTIRTRQEDGVWFCCSVVRFRDGILAAVRPVEPPQPSEEAAIHPARKEVNSMKDDVKQAAKDTAVEPQPAPSRAEGDDYQEWIEDFRRLVAAIEKHYGSMGAFIMQYCMTFGCGLTKIKWDASLEQPPAKDAQ